MTIICTDFFFMSCTAFVHTVFPNTEIADKHGHELRSETSEQQFHTKHEKSNQSGLNGDFFFTVCYVPSSFSSVARAAS